MAAQLFVGDMKKILRFASIFSVIQVADGTLIVKPENRAVVYGEEFILRCETDLGATLQWSRCLPGSTGENKIVHNGFEPSPDVAQFMKLLHSRSGEYSLQIRARKEAALCYRCLEPGSLNKSSATVTVLASDLTCNTICGDGFIEITCFMRFWGSWAPALELMRCDGTNEAADVSTTNTTNYRLINLKLRQNSNSSSFCFNVTAKFKGDGRPKGTDAENIPLYTYTNSYQCSDMRDSIVKDYRLTTTIVIVTVTASVTAIFGIVFLFIRFHCCKKFCARRQMHDCHIRCATSGVSCDESQNAPLYK